MNTKLRVGILGATWSDKGLQCSFNCLAIVIYTLYHHIKSLIVYTINEKKLKFIYDWMCI